MNKSNSDDKYSFTGKKGSFVIVKTLSGLLFQGNLVCFDIHLNVVMDDVEEYKDKSLVKSYSQCFIKGSTVLYIKS